MPQLSGNTFLEVDDTLMSICSQERCSPMCPSAALANCSLAVAVCQSSKESAREGTWIRLGLCSSSFFDQAQPRRYVLSLTRHDVLTDCIEKEKCYEDDSLGYIGSQWELCANR